MIARRCCTSLQPGDDGRVCDREPATDDKQENAEAEERELAMRDGEGAGMDVSRRLVGCCVAVMTDGLCARMLGRKTRASGGQS
jgi:hypothetical protein